MKSRVFCAAVLREEALALRNSAKEAVHSTASLREYAAKRSCANGTGPKSVCWSAHNCRPKPEPFPHHLHYSGRGCWPLYNREQFLCQLHQGLKKTFFINVLVTDFPSMFAMSFWVSSNAPPLRFIFWVWICKQHVNFKSASSSLLRKW